MSKPTVDYDDSRLWRMFAELERPARLRAVKMAFRREAARVRRVAVDNLRSKVASSRQIERGIRNVVYKRTAGFRVTIGSRAAPKGKSKGKGGGKPVLIWLEGGTERRFTRRGRRNRGVIRPVRFMARTLTRVRGTVGADLRRQVIESIIRISRKYGCK